MFYLNFGDGEESDAFRHCLRAAFIAKETDIAWAKRWTDAHEDVPDNDPVSREMDTHNNARGIKIIHENLEATSAKVIQTCVELIRIGELRTIGKGRVQPTTFKGYNIPNIFRVISEKVSEVVEFITNFHSGRALETDGDGNTALHRCIIDDYEEGFNILVKILDVNRPGMDGQSSLMLCSSLHYGYKYARALLERGANVDYQDASKGETALILAACHGNREMVEILLPVCNKQLKSFSGSTAYDMAVTEENLDIAKLLV